MIEFVLHALRTDPEIAVFLAIALGGLRRAHAIRDDHLSCLIILGY